MTDIWAGMEYIMDKRGKKVRAVFLDYLQRINTDDQKGDIRERYMRTMDKVKDLALASPPQLRSRPARTTSHLLRQPSACRQTKLCRLVFPVHSKA